MKKSKGKVIIIVIAILVILGIIGSIGGNKKDNKTEKPSVKTEQKKENKVNLSELDLNKVNPESKDFSSNLKEAIEGLNVEYNTNNKSLTLIYPDEGTWSETTLVKNFAYSSAKIMKTFAKNPNINSVTFIRKTKMIDNKGNESVDNGIVVTFNKETMSTINFNNWINLLYQKNNASKFYGLAESYQIMPGIYSKVSPELRKEMEQ